MEVNYGIMTVKELKLELKSRKASLRGRKKDLIDRLIYYDRNSNFGNNLENEPEIALIKTPPLDLYKDINVSSPCPNLTDSHIMQCMNLFEKYIAESAKEMYLNGFLRYVRFCIQDNLYFVSSKCEAQMRKNITYDVNISLSLDGEIHECTCECTAGHSKSAHCKHVCITLFSIRDIHLKKSAITRQTTTQQLQTFHHPSKRYSGSPLKAKDMNCKKFKQNIYFNSDQVEESEDEDPAYTIWYKNYFKNLIKSRSFGNNMNMKQLMEPANPYAIINDHDYLKHDAKYTILKSLCLIDVSLRDIEKIENETLEQSSNDAWYKYRSVRITASRFYECCKDLNGNQKKRLINDILHPKKLSSKSISHGVIYEKTAIELFEKVNLQSKVQVDRCGLLIIKDYPFIAASPDGLLCELTIVEVKCPYSSRYLIANEETVSYLYKTENGGLSLKKDHPYYYQIQGQLMVTGRTYCDFLVYTFKSLIRITIHRDEEFIRIMLSRLIDLYENHLKPAIFNKYIYRDYDLIFKKSV